MVVISPYPWAAGFYDMNADTDHCTTNSTALPEMLKPLGYRTHALGKWDVGFLEKKCSPTYRGFDTFFGRDSPRAVQSFLVRPCIFHQ